VLVLPSRSEAFGLVFVEALMVGTPVVGFAPALADLRAILGDEVGLPFDAILEKPADLARKILTVLAQSPNRPVLARRTAEAFSWDAGFPHFDRIYRQAMSR
jgi:glycosyltransferase involved in cell wall biosynthesis